jgi:hypothetical protein
MNDPNASAATNCAAACGPSNGPAGLIAHPLERSHRAVGLQALIAQRLSCELGRYRPGREHVDGGKAGHWHHGAAVLRRRRRSPVGEGARYRPTPVWTGLSPHSGGDTQDEALAALHRARIPQTRRLRSASSGAVHVARLTHAIRRWLAGLHRHRVPGGAGGGYAGGGVPRPVGFGSAKVRGCAIGAASSGSMRCRYEDPSARRRQQGSRWSRGFAWL